MLFAQYISSIHHFHNFLTTHIPACQHYSSYTSYVQRKLGTYYCTLHATCTCVCYSMQICENLRTKQSNYYRRLNCPTTALWNNRLLLICDQPHMAHQLAATLVLDILRRGFCTLVLLVYNCARFKLRPFSMFSAHA